MNKVLHVIFILTICISNLYSQDQSDNFEYIQTSLPLNFLSSRFDKQLNTFNLNSRLLFNKNIGNFNLNLNENYLTTYIRTADASSRDEHTFYGSGSYSFNPLFSFGLHADNDIYSDSRQIEINQASVSSVSLFTQINPAYNFSFAPFFGYENNRQIGESDYGYIYGGEGLLDNLSVSDFDVQSQLKFENEDISPRKNLLRFVNFSASNKLNENFSNIVNFQYSQSRKDFYFLADSVTAKQFGILNNIQSRTETANVLQDSLRLGSFLSAFTQDLTGRVSWRTIDRDTKYKSLALMSPSIFDSRINEMRIDLESSTNLHTNFFDGGLRLNYSERDERHLALDFPGSNPIFLQERQDQENMKNNISKRISLSFTGKANFSSTDKLYFSFLQNKLRYDTPSQQNYDDRDELLSIVRIKYVKSLNPFFDVFVNTEGTYNHIVYIFSEESSNNNINRILKFGAGGTYHGKNVSSTNSFDVSANYTVYDFEDINPNYRSFSFRQFSAMDSSSVKIIGRISLVHYGYVRLSEQGDLKWASFSTHPTRYLEEIYSEPKFMLDYPFGNFALGMRIYSLLTFNYQGIQKIPDTKYISLAPLTEISIFMNSTLAVNLIGWYEFITLTDLSKKQQVSLTMRVNWNF